MPTYHIIVSLEDSARAKALADRYSDLVRSAVADPGQATPA
jgi:hypothetical protein